MGFRSSWRRYSGSTLKVYTLIVDVSKIVKLTTFNILAWIRCLDVASKCAPWKNECPPNRRNLLDDITTSILFFFLFQLQNHVRRNLSNSNAWKRFLHSFTTNSSVYKTGWHSPKKWQDPNRKKSENTRSIFILKCNQCRFKYRTPTYRSSELLRAR